MHNKQVHYYYYKFDEELIGVNEVNHMTAVESVLTEVGLRWFKTVSSTFPRRRFWWVIISTLYQLMLQSWYQKTTFHVFVCTM